MLGLDRKKMEEERLARLVKKRKRDGSISPPPMKREQKVSQERSEILSARSYSSIHIPLKHQDSSAPVVESTHDHDTGSTVSYSEAPHDTGNSETVISIPDEKPESILQFPQGKIKRTWSANHPRHNDIKIEEVLLKDKLKTAVFSSFLWDSKWLFTKVNPTKTRIIFVMGAESDVTRYEHEVQAEELGIKMCFARLPQGKFSKMHSKLMLLFYDNFLRIVIPTANLMPYDWGETGFMENTVFLIDLPRRTDGKCGSKEDLTFFGQELLYFLEQMDLWDKARDGILNFDFSQTKNMAFIHSIAGSHFGQEMQRTGYIGLGRSIRQLGLQTSNIKLDFASASIGSLDLKTVSSFYHSCRGTPVGNLGSQDSSLAQQQFRIYFPTIDTVRDSMGGFPNAGTVCIQRKWWERKDFPRSMFDDYQSVREGILSHNKILFARGSRPGSLDKQVSWVYVGSANLSSSAWGKLTHDRQKREDKLTCANWECGVVVVGNTSDGQGQLTDGSLHSAFSGVLEVPFKEPAKPYKHSMEPWYFLEHVDN